MNIADIDNICDSINASVGVFYMFFQDDTHCSDTFKMVASSRNEVHVVQSLTNHRRSFMYYKILYQH